LAGQLNREWTELVAAPASWAAPGRWALTCPVLIGVRTLDEVLALIAGADAPTRDAVLLALVGRAQAGDALAGRTVLQTMLGKAVRVAGTVAGRDDVRGDREEALARAVAALWQAIATYPVARRPGRVAANLALDTVAIAQRGATGSSHFAAAAGRCRWPTSPPSPLPDRTGAWTGCPVRRTPSCSRCWLGLCAGGWSTWTRRSCCCGSTASTSTAGRPMRGRSPSRPA
jgi:hypothetical protein